MRKLSMILNHKLFDDKINDYQLNTVFHFSTKRFQMVGERNFRTGIEDNILLDY